MDCIQASPSSTNSWSLLKLMPTESVMPSGHLILCRPLSSCPQSLPALGSFPVCQVFASGGQRTGVSVSATFLPMNIQDRFPLIWLVWFPCCPRDSQESSPHHSSKASIRRRSAFFMVQLSYPYMTTGKTISLTKWTFVSKVLSLLLNMLSRSIIAINFMVAVTTCSDFGAQENKVSHCSTVFPSMCHEVIGWMPWWS